MKYPHTPHPKTSMRPELPQGLEEQLRRINPDVELRWNPTAKCIKKPEYTILGKFTSGEYEGRYEVWSKDNVGQEYKVMTVQDQTTGRFMLPDQWLADWLRVLYGESDKERKTRTIQDFERRLSSLPKADLARFFEKVGNLEDWAEALSNDIANHAQTKVYVPGRKSLIIPSSR